MKVLTFDTNEEWLAARRCKITGSRLKDIVVKRGTGKKKGFYELIVERIGLPADGESPMDRGHRLEEEAVDRFIAMTGRAVDTSLVIWTRDDNDSIAVSPDGVVSDTEALEVKCLNSAAHIEAYLTKQIPDEYRLQALQYFIVNEALHTLYFCFYDPRLRVADFFVITVKREEVQEEIDAMLAYQRETLTEIDQIVNELLTI